MGNRIEDNNIHTHRLNETHAAGCAFMKKRLTRKKRRGGTADTIGKAKNGFFEKKGGDNILDGQGPGNDGSYQSHNGLYFPGPGLMAYALEAMLLDIKGGLQIMNAVGSSQVAMFQMIGDAYDKLAAAQKDQYKQQARQALFGAIFAGASAVAALGLTAYGIKKWGSGESELKTLNSDRDKINAKIGDGDPTAEIEDVAKENKEPLVNVEKINRTATGRKARALKMDENDPERERELGRAGAEIDAEKRNLTKKDEEIKFHQEKMRQTQTTMQNLSSMAQGLQATGTKSTEAIYAPLIGAAQARQTQADKIKTQANVVYQAADQMYNRVVNNLDQDFQSLGNAAQQAENLKQRGAAA